MDDIQKLIPQHKFDTERAQAVIQTGYPAIEPILPQLLEWIQDMNWPVALILAPFLSSIGNPLAPHIKIILSSNDEIWKYWILNRIVQASSELAISLRREIERLAFTPTAQEVTEEVNIAALEVMVKNGWGQFNI